MRSEYEISAGDNATTSSPATRPISITVSRVGTTTRKNSKWWSINYNSATQQNRLYQELREEWFKQAAEDEIVAVNRIHSKIVDYFPRIRTEHQPERQTVELMRVAVISQSWATGPIRNIDRSDKPSSATFFADLFAAAQLQREISTATGNTEQTILFNYQPRYGRPNRGKSYSPKTGVRTCWNCREPGHMARQCPKTGERKDFLHKAVQVLYGEQSDNSNDEKTSVGTLFNMPYNQGLAQLQVQEPDEGFDPAEQ
eukprot:Plantae.Rhodophyta-Rhodochaete_pulchella.ctg28609.p1 GENE.Plantae.Rhodophyta-Rhodochaete_pulchella.ctg28609~~Plantae.Rhodophyta-Rhodochaete_pulchella.ctg28609.p1  ORF type:complete len:256 (+),score=22.91 Plantae.Rhodophyta-Rhodochaete_pulchella.ctg28609:1148-1915(+)